MILLSFEKQEEQRAAHTTKIRKNRKEESPVLEKEIKEIDFRACRLNYDQTIAQPNFFDELPSQKE